MSPVNLTARALFGFLKIRLNDLQKDILDVAGFHRWNDVSHTIETITRVNVIIKSEIEFIFEHWMAFFHHSTPPLSIPAMKVYNALVNILTVKLVILAHPVNTETVATLLLEYNKLNDLIPIANAELDVLNQLSIDLNVDPPIVGPRLPQPPQNITPFPRSDSSSSSSSSSLFGNQVHPLDMVAAKIYFKTYRKSRKLRKSRKPRKPRKLRKSRKPRKLRKSRKPKK
jgi:hypothetical protein